MKRKRTMFLVLFFIGIGIATAQTQVRGTVVDEAGEPIIGASILVKGTSQGTTTDINGAYTIPVPAEGKIFVISYVGMITKEVAIKPDLRIVLESDTKLLEEIVVTAMGITRSEKTLGYSATNVSSDEISKARNTNITNSLSGKVAGLQVQSTSSDPGAANSIVIRGFGSINGSNQPLYVVDGVPLQSGSLTSQGHSVGTMGISNIASDDIESMTILKGAAATALYGSRASNGVIVVTTKQGKKGASRNFSIQYNGGVQAREVSVFPIMQNDFGQGWNGMQTWIENGSWGPRLDGSTQPYGPIWNNQQLLHEYSALKNNVKDFFEIGQSWNHSISFSGLSEDNKVGYYLSYSDTSDDGIMPSKADYYSRNTIATRGTYNATYWLKISSSVNFARAKTDIVGSYQGTSVIDGLYELPRDVSLLDKQDLSSPFNTPEAYFTPYGITNPFWALANNYHHLDSKQIYGKLQADINPIKELTLTYRYGFDYSDYDRKVGTPEIALDDALITDNKGYPPSKMNQAGSVFTSYRRGYEFNHDFLANFEKKFEKISLTAIAGFNINERAATSLSGETEELSFHTDFWDLSNGATKKLLEEGQSKRRLIGLFGDVTIGFDEMLFLNLTARNDWSSTLPINDNSYFYPGATLSWIFSNLLPKNDYLSFGKIRLAYGKTGNDATPYLTLTNYVQAYANGYYGRDIALFPMNGKNAFIMGATAGSSTLRPEMNKEFEVGLNLQFFKGRVGIDAAYYNRITSDQIFTLPIDPATGFSQNVINFGEVRNKGLELLLNTTPIETKKFRWDVDFNIAINRNKVLSMPESLEGGKVTINRFSAGNDAVYMYAEKDKPMGTYYTYHTQFVTDENSPYYGYRIVDEAGQPKLDTEVSDTGLDMNHKWTGGISTSLSAYGFTLSAVLDVRYGGVMFSRTKNLMQFTGNGIVTTYNDRRPFIIPNSVQAVTDDAGKVTYKENVTPIKLTNSSYQDYFDKYGWGHGGLAYLVDRSFAKLRNITLSYTLPKKWINTLHLSEVALSGFVNNAFLWTAKDNYYIDPESSTTGVDLGGNFGELYVNPANRIYGFNLGVKF